MAALAVALVVGIAVLAPNAIGGSSSAGSARLGQYGGGGAPADMKVLLAASPGSVSVGDTFTYLATVSNRGAGATSVHLYLDLPPAVTLVSSTSDRGPGHCLGTQSLDCPLDFFPTNLTTTVRVVVKVASAGDLTTKAHVTSFERDANLADNAATVVPQLAQPTQSPTGSPGATGTPSSARSKSAVRVALMAPPAIVAGTPWSYRLRVTNAAGRPVAATLRLELLLRGRTLARLVRKSTAGGALSAVLPRSALPASARGKTVVLRVVVTSRAGTVTRSWTIRVR